MYKYAALESKIKKNTKKKKNLVRYSMGPLTGRVNVLKALHESCVRYTNGFDIRIISNRQKCCLFSPLGDTLIYCFAANRK